MDNIDILLPVYNGSPYLKVLIDSILSQEYSGWKLIIRDDSSADGSLDILEKYSGEHPGRIELLKPDGIKLGIMKNYEKLLGVSTADYIMLCDQDDKWFPDKVGRSYRKIKEIEEECGRDLPILVHSDLTVADGNLNIIDRSLWNYQRLNPEAGRSLNRLLVQNCITGCTVIVNRKLKEYSLPFPDEAVMHDWWMALNAAAFGRIGYIRDPLIYYRQHGTNAVGSFSFNLKYIINSFVYKRELIKKNLQNAQKQASAFLKLNGKRLGSGNYKITFDYANIAGYNFIKKRWILLKNGFFKSGFVRTIGLFFFI